MSTTPGPASPDPTEPAAPAEPAEPGLGGSTRVQAGRTRRAPWRAVARPVALVLYVALLVGAATVGEWPGSYDDLRAGLRDGSVTQVRIEDSMDGPDGAAPTVSGTATPRLSWRDGLFRAHTSVVQTTPDVSVQGGGNGGGDVTGRVTGSVGADLRREAPGVRLTYEAGSAGVRAAVLGAELRGTAWALSTVAFIGLLFALLVSAGDTRLATRWGWTWAFLSPALLVAAPLYLLYGHREPAPGARRLNGWLSFLVFSVILPGAVAWPR